MFQYNDSLVKVNFYNTDASLVTTMEKMFSSCSSLKNLYTKGLNTPNLKTMREMFRDCDELESISLPTFDTPKVTDMRDMFNSCTSLVGGNGTKYDPNKITAAYACVDTVTQKGYLTLGN